MKNFCNITIVLIPLLYQPADCLSCYNLSHMVWHVLHCQTSSITSIYSKYLSLEGEPERASIADLMFCHSIQTMEFVTVCCSMRMVGKTLCSHFSSQGSYYSYTHAWTKLNNEVIRISGAYECHYAWPLPEANSTTVRDSMVPSVSSLPLSVKVCSHIQ